MENIEKISKENTSSGPDKKDEASCITACLPGLLFFSSIILCIAGGTQGIYLGTGLGCLTFLCIIIIVIFQKDDNDSPVIKEIPANHPQYNIFLDIIREIKSKHKIYTLTTLITRNWIITSPPLLNWIAPEELNDEVFNWLKSNFESNVFNISSLEKPEKFKRLGSFESPLEVINEVLLEVLGENKKYQIGRILTSNWIIYASADTHITEEWIVDNFESKIFPISDYPELQSSINPVILKENMLSQVLEEIRGKEKFRIDNIVFTSNWVISLPELKDYPLDEIDKAISEEWIKKWFNSKIYHLRDIMWVYNKYVTHGRRGKRTQETYKTYILFRDGNRFEIISKTIQPLGEIIEGKHAMKMVSDRIVSLVPWIKAGFSEVLDRKWSNERSSFISSVDREREKYQT